MDTTEEKLANIIRNLATEESKISDEDIEGLISEVIRRIGKEKLSEREILRLLEDVILESPFKHLARAFILYRSNTQLVERYINLEDWEVKENSNMTYSLQGLNFYITSHASKDYWLNKIYGRDIKKAHKEGDFHIHQLHALSVYCVGWDLWDLLATGFRGVPGKTESKPPKHLSSALGQVVNFLYTLQGEATGAQAFSNFDTLLAPFIRYDRLDYKQVKQAVQEFIYNLNVPTRTGFQAPFTNLTFDLKVPEYYMHQGVLIGGEIRNETYGEFQEEMDMLNRAFFEVMMEGDAKGRVFTFPIPTYNITKDFDWDNPNYEGLWKMTGKYGIPYFANFVNEEFKLRKTFSKEKMS